MIDAIAKDLSSDRQQLITTIAALEAQRALLGDAVVETALSPLRARLEALQASAASDGERTSVKRQPVTLLFARLSGSTPSILSMLDTVIVHYGGSIVQRLSDGILALWGAERAQETHADTANDSVQAVRAALELQAHARQFDQPEDAPLAIQIGLHTGMITLPLTTAETAGERNITVTTHLASAAPSSGALLSQMIYDQVRGQFTVEVRPPLLIENEAELLQTYLAKSEKNRSFYMPVRRLAGITTRTIGRQSEIKQLQTAYQDTIQEQMLHWITVIGEAGLGKSRLLTEFEQWLELRPELIRYFKGRAWPHTRKTPYFLLRNLLAYRFQINDGDELETARGKLTTGLAEALGPERAEEAAAFLGQLVGFDFRNSPWITNIAENTRQIRGRAEVLLGEFFAALCKIRPVFVCLEDLHWADNESLEMIAALLQEAHPWRMCVLSLARPNFMERRLPWGKGLAGAPLAHHKRINLSPLTQTASRELAYELLQRVAAPPEWMIELLIGRSAGNPYFMEELVHWLIEEGVIQTGPERWQVTIAKPVGLSIPGTIQGVLQARLENLSPTLRSALQRAAVIGRMFWDDAVTYIGEEPISPEVWDALLNGDLIRAVPNSQLPGARQYMFCQVLLRDVVYEYTLVKLRQEYHCRAAEWLIKSAGNRASEWATVIADHYQEAGEISQAAKWYHRAGVQAQTTYAPDTAIQYYQRALNLIGSAAELAADAAALHLEIYPGLGETLRWRARYEQALQVFKAMLNTAGAVGDQRKQAQAWLGLSQTQDSQGNYQATLHSAEQAERFAQAAGVTALAELAQSLYRKGWAHYRLGNGEAALILGQQALEMSAKLNDVYQMANSHNLLGGAYNLLGQYAEAMPHNQHALEFYRSLGDRERVASMLSNLGEHCRLNEDYRTAVAYYREALQMAKETANRSTEMVFNNNLGGALVGLGDFIKAEEHLRTTIQIAELTGQSGWVSETYRFLSEACLGQGHLEQARNAALKALSLGKEVQAQEMIGAAWRVLGNILARSTAPILIDNVPVDAETCFTNSLQVFEQTGMQGELGRTLRAWGEYEIHQGNPPRGEQMLQQARQIFSTLGMLWQPEDKPVE